MDEAAGANLAASTRVGALLEPFWRESLERAVRQLRSPLFVSNLDPERWAEEALAGGFRAVFLQARLGAEVLQDFLQKHAPDSGRPAVVMVRPDANRASILRDLQAGVSEVVTQHSELAGVVATLSARAPEESPEEGTAEIRAILGRSAPIERIRREIRSFTARRFRSVLVRGESGVGKELVARALWSISGWRGGPFEAIAAPAIPLDHLEAELFGTEPGSFTGATRRAGLVERANGGVLFMDEIAAMPADHQAKILRFLDDGVGRRLGSPQSYKVDLGIVFATHENLARGIEEERFRSDLYHRMSADGVITVPPLRERADDIPRIARAFLPEVGCRELSHSAEAVLCDFDWPGNVRQLRSVLRAAARRARSGVVDGAGVLESLREMGSELGKKDQGATSFAAVANEPRRELLIDALRRAGGSFTEAGILLGFHRTKEGRDRDPQDRLARKSAQRRFEYWWVRLVGGAET
jgi:DNA-binding NtrC family response regulator